MKKAIALCIEGENWLSLKQIFRDWDEVTKQIKFKSTSAKSLFPKWYRILEIKLEQNLHHQRLVLAQQCIETDQFINEFIQRFDDT